MAGDTGSQRPLLKPVGYILPQAPHPSQTLGTKFHFLIVRKPMGRDGETEGALVLITTDCSCGHQQAEEPWGGGKWGGGCLQSLGQARATLCSHTARGSACSWALCLLLSSAARIN